MKFQSALYQDHTFGDTIAVVHSDQLVEGRILILHGGSDISPSIYNQRVGRAHAEPIASRRDEQEIDLYNAAVEKGIPVFGICRGAQLICALNGGTLWQHVDNHAGRSHTFYYAGKEFMTNSYHHQMMRPICGEVLGETPALSLRKWAEDDEPEVDTKPEPEIVFWKHSKSLGVQGHPEWVGKDAPFFKLCVQLMKEKLCVQ